jgi:HK97 family phage prohead protease
VSGLEIRDAGPNAWSVKGLATTWDRPYFVVERNGDTFREVIERGAFDTAISGVDPVDLRVEHDQRMRALASTDGGSLAFNDGEKGLVLAAGLLKSDPASADAVRRVRDGELRGLSVGMVVPGGGDTRGVDKDGRTELRRIYRAHLNEVSLVQSPANPFATISDVRSERNGERVEYRFFPFADREFVPIDTERLAEALSEVRKAQGEDGSSRSAISLAPNDTDEMRLELEWSTARSGRASSAKRPAVLLPNDTNELQTEFWRMQLRGAA